jgi:16S rRNA (guanine527-N7)-methyltransferase
LDHLFRRALYGLAEKAPRVLGRPLETRELKLFYKYLSLLQKWQKVQRLVGSSDPAWIVDNLVLDSLLFLQFLSPGAASVADLGSGAGFPGIPVKIVSPQINLALIESRQKRVSFLSSVVRELELTDTRVVASRAESLSAEYRGAFDAVLIRCAGDIDVILPTAARLARAGGIVVLAGSPERRHIRDGERVEVAGIRPGSTRAFVTFRP